MASDCWTRPRTLQLKSYGRRVTRFKRELAVGVVAARATSRGLIIGVVVVVADAAGAVETGADERGAAVIVEVAGLIAEHELIDVGEDVGNGGDVEDKVVVAALEIESGRERFGELVVGRQRDFIAAADLPVDAVGIEARPEVGGGIGVAAEESELVFPRQRDDVGAGMCA